MSNTEELRRKYFPHLFPEENQTSGRVGGGQPKAITTTTLPPQTTKAVTFPVPSLPTEQLRVNSYQERREASPPPPTTTQKRSSPRDGLGSYSHSHKLSRLNRDMNGSTGSGGSGGSDGSNDHSTISSLTQQSNISSSDAGSMIPPGSVSTTLAIAPQQSSRRTSEHQPQRASLTQISSAHDPSVRMSIASQQQHHAALTNATNAVTRQMEITPYKSDRRRDQQQQENEEDLPFSPPKELSSLLSTPPLVSSTTIQKTMQSPSKEDTINTNNNTSYPPPESQTDTDTETQSESLQDIIFMKSLSLPEKVAVMIFITLILVFQLTVNVEDIINFDYKNNSLWLVENTISLTQYLVEQTSQYLLKRIHETDWKKALTIVCAVSYLTYFFDRNTDKTDLYILTKVKQMKSFYGRCQQQLRSTLHSLILFYHYLVKKWNQIPRLVQYCTIFFLLSTAVKYGLLRVLISMKPTIVKVSMIALPYVTAITFFIGLFQLLSMWRMKSIRKQVATELVYERIKTLIQVKDVFYSMEQMKEDMNEDETIDLEEYTVDGLWQDVKNMIKLDSDIQLNDFYVQGKKVQHLGYKPNNPRVPKL